MRNAVLAGVVLSHEPVTRFSLGQMVGERFAGVLVSWHEKHAYDHVRVLAADRLIVPMSARQPPRYRASPAGVEAWRAWLVSPIGSRDPLREALARVRSCREENFTTMGVIIDLLEERMLLVLEELAAADDCPLTELLANTAQRDNALSCLRWCQKARDDIAARAAAR